MYKRIRRKCAGKMAENHRKARWFFAKTTNAAKDEKKRHVWRRTGRMHHRDIGRLHDDYKRVGRWCGAAIPNLPLSYQPLHFAKH